MASVEYIIKRIEGKQKEIEKLQKKLERIEKAEATGWTVNPYYYHESDKKWTLRDLEEAKNALAKYEADLVIANEKAASRNVPAIQKFLDIWKERMTKFFGDGLKEYFDEGAAVYELYKYANSLDYGTEERAEAQKKYEAANKAYKVNCYGRFETREHVRNGRTIRNEYKVEEGKYEYLRPYNREYTLKDAMAKLKKDLDAEAIRKYDFIIERTNAIVGKITDASALEVGEKGDLNGFIKGERGTAKVETIGAGGYNIQCFHFRTLIHEVK